MKRIILKATLILFVLAFIFEIGPYLVLQAIAASKTPISIYHFSHTNMTHRRFVPGQPSHYMHRILIVGNSAAYGYGVDDNSTWAAYLQSMLKDTLVTYLGVSSTGNIAGELLALYNTPLHAGDVIVSYDGASEYAEAYPNPPFCSWSLGLAWLACRQINLHSYSSTEEARGLANVKRILGLMREYVAQHGATVIHIWQPMMIAPINAEERRMLDYAARMLPADFGGSTGDVSVAKRFWAADSDSLNFTNLLTVERQAGDVMFLDPVHTSPVANQIIARAIYDHLYRAF